jgi:hypothetical protein
MENVTDINGLVDAALEARGSQYLEVLQQHIQQQYVSNKAPKTVGPECPETANKTRIEWIPPF